MLRGYVCEIFCVIVQMEVVKNLKKKVTKGERISIDGSFAIYVLDILCYNIACILINRSADKHLVNKNTCCYC